MDTGGHPTDDHHDDDGSRHDHPHAPDLSDPDAPCHSHPHDPGHSHPQPHPAGPTDADAGEPARARIGVIGAGRVGTVLGIALSRAGWPVVAVASRDPDRRARFQRLVPGARAFSEAPAILDDVDLALVAVPDDAIAEVASTLRLYGGQAVVHTSGLLEASVLWPALAAGAMAGGFHPLVAFADIDRAVDAIPGSTIAIEADQPLLALLRDMAESLGAQPVRIPGGAGKVAYHAAAMLAAGGFVGLLHAIAEVARGAGLDEAGAIAIYAPLIRQSLENAESLGIDGALTGPVVRGDEGTMRAHVAALEELAPDALPLYRAVAAREIEIATARGELSREAADRLAAVVDPAARPARVG